MGGYTLGGIVVLALDIWAVINIFQSSADNGKKVLWTLLVVLFPIIGLIIWALAGPRGKSA